MFELYPSFLTKIIQPLRLSPRSPGIPTQAFLTPRPHYTAVSVCRITLTTHNATGALSPYWREGAASKRRAAVFIGDTITILARHKEIERAMAAKLQGQHINGALFGITR
jgi:hypothetical protein